MNLNTARFFSAPFFSGVSFWLLILGLLFFLFSLAHKTEAAENWDIRSFRYLNTRLQRISGIFIYIWPLGTTPVAVLMIAMTYLPSLRTGLITTITFFILSIGEGIIKKGFNRPRPFLFLSDIQGKQPVHPKDASFPSGDAMRSWFIAITIPLVFHLPIVITSIACIVAIFLSLGRIVLGVHFPLDVLGGMGLGFIGAAIVSYSLGTPLTPFL